MMTGRFRCWRVENKSRDVEPAIARTPDTGVLLAAPVTSAILGFMAHPVEPPSLSAAVGWEHR